MQKKRERFGRLAVLAATVVLVVSLAALTALAADGEEAGMTSGARIVQNALPAVDADPIHNPAGSQMIVPALTIVPTCDGYIDAAEWADAYMYDISDTTGQHDGVPDPLGTVYLWLKQDDIGVYFAVRDNADQVVDVFDEVAFYFDDNHDGCFPTSATTEGDQRLTYLYPTTMRWRPIQDSDCGFPGSYSCYGDSVGTGYFWVPTCFGIGIGPAGVVDYEAMFPFGAADEHLDLTMPPDSLGFFIYCFDFGAFNYHGTWPSQGRDDTWREPCYYGHLICETGEEWPDHKMHFPQLPNPNGWDVLATYPVVAADDFMCTESGPITGIHLWGSWWMNQIGAISGFHLSIHSNIPGPPYSRPGDLLWSTEVTDFVETPMPPESQGWYDPLWPFWDPADHVDYFRYDITDIPEPFVQDSGTIYWLDVMAFVAGPGYPDAPLWGWKTSLVHWEDDAVWALDDPPYYWVPLEDPVTGVTLDLAFVITAGGEQPVICGDVNNDGIVNVGDIVYLVSYLYKSGPAPIPMPCVGDVNNDDIVNVGDIVYLVSYLYKSGPAPDPNCCNPPWKK
jgi:hypothetical protein